MGEDCPHCVFEKTEANCPGCFEGSHYRPKPMTNYDRIRAMSVEEMAEFLETLCPSYSWPLALHGMTWFGFLQQEASE